MSRNDKFHNPKAVYFVSLSVVGWIDVFTKNEYKEILLDTLRIVKLRKEWKLGQKNMFLPVPMTMLEKKEFWIM